MRLSTAVAGSAHRCSPTQASSRCWALGSLRWLHNLVRRDGERQARRPKPSSMTSAWLLRARARTLTSVVKRRRPTTPPDVLCCRAAQKSLTWGELPNLELSLPPKAQTTLPSPRRKTHTTYPPNTAQPVPTPHYTRYCTPHQNPCSSQVFFAKMSTAFTYFHT